MAFQDAENAIQARVDSLWAFPAVPIFWPNKGFTAPPGPYARVDIIGAEESIISYGGGRNNNLLGIAGAAVGTFAVPLGADLNLSRKMRDKFAEILRYTVFSGVHFYGVTPVGGDRYADDGRHFRLGATAEFLYRYRG